MNFCYLTPFATQFTILVCNSRERGKPMKFSTHPWRSILGGLTGVLLATAAYAAAPHEAPMRDFASSSVAGWISNPMVV